MTERFVLHMLLQSSCETGCIPPRGIRSFLSTTVGLLIESRCRELLEPLIDLGMWECGHVPCMCFESQEISSNQNDCRSFYTWRIQIIISLAVYLFLAESHLRAWRCIFCQYKEKPDFPSTTIYNFIAASAQSLSGRTEFVTAYYRYQIVYQEPDSRYRH